MRRDPVQYELDRAAFFAEAGGRCRPETVQVLRELHATKLRDSDDPDWPFGKASFAFRVDRGTTRCSVFNAYRSGRLTILFCYLRGRRSGVPEVVWQQFADDLAQIGGFANIREEMARTGVVHYWIEETLTSAHDLSAFTAAVLRVRDGMRVG